MQRRYTLQQAAERLGISAATLLFWEESFHELLNAPRGTSGEPEFTDEHLARIGQIQRRVLSEGASLDEVRRELAGGEDDGRRPVEPLAATQDGAEGLQVVEAGRAIDALSARLEEVECNLSFLLDENQALQRLLGRVVEHIDRLEAANPQAGVTAPFEHKNPHESPGVERSGEPTAGAGRRRVLPHGGLGRRIPTVRPWAPRSLRGRAPNR